MEKFKGQVTALLQALHCEADVKAISVEMVDAEVNTLTITSMGIGVDVGWPIELSSIAGKRIVPGYRVFYLKVHHASRWQPEEVEDVTTMETDGAFDALEGLGALIVKDIVRGIAESSIPEF